MNPAVSDNTKTIASDYYSLAVNHFPEETKITMALSIPHVTTVAFPNTVKILQEVLPGVLTSTCFNDLSLPFKKEVKRTELGHLFEHILLEYLCVEKSLLGMESEYNGVTSWDWTIDPLGTFHIVVDAGFQDTERLSQAMKKSIELLNIIIRSNRSLLN